MRVLVTGATGFVGRHLAAALAADGERVRALARPGSGASGLERLGVEVMRGDVTDPEAVSRAARDCRHVYHLAALTPRPGVGRREYLSVNTEGTKAVGLACLRAGVERLVYASSSGVYGVVRRPPVDERSPTNPTSGYRESKLRGEEALRALREREGLGFVAARLPGVIGRGSLSWLGLVRAVATGRFRLIGPGENYDHTCDVADTVEGLRLCARTPGADGECYLLADSRPVKVKRLVELIARELGLPAPSRRPLPAAPYRAFNALGELLYKTARVELPGVYRYSIFLAEKVLVTSKAERELGFRAKVPVEESVRATVGWYKEEGYV